MTRVAALVLKLWRLCRSDLRWRDQAVYIMNRFWAEAGTRRYHLRGGGTVLLRCASTDRKVFDEVFLDQIYAPAVALLSAPETPTILVDLGANTGLSTIFLARRLNLTRIIAVEPCPENYRMLQENTRSLGDCCTVVQAFAGAERGFATLLDPGFGAWGLRMGDSGSAGTPVLPLLEILPDATGTRIFLKCDIEGSERHLFRRIRDWEQRVDFIVLELHTEFFTAAEFEKCLAGSAFYWNRHGVVRRGAVLAVIALERAQRRTTTQSLASIQSKHDS